MFIFVSIIKLSAKQRTSHIQPRLIDPYEVKYFNLVYLFTSYLYNCLSIENSVLINNSPPFIALLRCITLDG